VQRHRGVQGRLAAEGGEQRVRDAPSRSPW
jgi:hypothetical protein